MPYADVPFIDVSALRGTDLEAKVRAAKEMHDALRGTGFFYATNHGVDVRELQRVTRTFHETITDEERWRLAIRAYNPTNTKQIRNGYYMPIKGKKAVESFCYLNPAFTLDHHRILARTPLHEVNEWPDEQQHPGFRAFQEAYFWQVFELSMALLRGLALGLGLAEDFFDAHCTRHDTLSSVVLIRYPWLADYPPVKVAPDGTQLSFDWHEDVSVLTVLNQTGVENLQVETPRGFLDIPAAEDAFLVNVGSFIPIITMGYLKTPIHRVKFVNAERLSLPFFLNFNFDSSIAPFVPPVAGATTTPSASSGCENYGEYLQRELQNLIKKNGQT